MSVYYFICSCGNERIVHLSMKDISTHVEICSCGNVMTQDYSKKRYGTVLKGLGWARDGYNTDIDDAEEHWKKIDPSKVGKHVGKTSWKQAKKDKVTWRKKQRKYKGI